MKSREEKLRKIRDQRRIILLKAGKCHRWGKFIKKILRKWKNIGKFMLVVFLIRRQKIRNFWKSFSWNLPNFLLNFPSKFSEFFMKFFSLIFHEIFFWKFTEVFIKIFLGIFLVFHEIFPSFSWKFFLEFS